MRISIEGNIGSGKTQLIRSLGNPFIVFEENVIGWGPWLERFCENPQRWAFALQTKVLLDMSNIPKNVIVERSPFTARHVFTKRLHHMGYLSDMENRLYLEFYDRLGWKPDVIIYLCVEPAECFARVQQRNREYETNSITLEMLCDIHRYHETLFRQISVPVFKLDGKKPPAELLLNLREILQNMKF